MRRILFVALTGAALMAFGPGTALARHHHQRRHHRSHHHARFHRERWGSDNAGGGSGGGSEDTAGTVASFTGGVLTIRLNDGSMVSGKVTDATELECEAADTESMQNDEHSSGGEDNGGDNGDQNENNDDQGEDQSENEQSCTAADLTQGTVVQEAVLTVSSAGAIWQKVDLVK